MWVWVHEQEGTRLLVEFRQQRLKLRIGGWQLSSQLCISPVQSDLPSGILLRVREDLKAASACDRLPSRLRTELDEEATDILASWETFDPQ